MSSIEQYVDLSTILYDDDESRNSVAKNQYSMIKKIVMSLKSFGLNKMNVDAACAISKEVSILVCGPTRVGKSSLIKALTGCNVHTTSSLNSDTQFATAYRFENDKVVVWDTKGFENWHRKMVDNFWDEHFSKKRILPSFCIFCVGIGAYADTDLINYMFNKFLFRYKIPVCWVITKGGTTDPRQLTTYIQEGVELLGEISEVIKETIAWKTEKGFIIRVNSVDTNISIPGGNIHIPVFGINTLCNILARNVSLETQEHLMELYKNNESFLSHVAAGLFETAYKFGFPVTNFLDEEKKKLFVKVSGKTIPFELNKHLAEAFLANVSNIYSVISK